MLFSFMPYYKKRRIEMLKNEQLSSLFSVTDNETDYDEEKRKKKQKTAPPGSPGT